MEPPETAGEPVLAGPGTFPKPLPPNLLTLPKPSGTAKPVPEIGMHFWAKNMDEYVAKSSTWNLPRGLLLDPLLCYICWTPNELFAIEAYVCEVLSFAVCNILSLCFKRAMFEEFITATIVH